jgi:GNAT superfamily N-acetyltransferase
MAVELKEVTTRKDLKTFVKFPHILYQANSCWVPSLNFDEMNTLDKEKNPAFEHCQARCWLAYSDGKVVGRVAAILNQKHIELRHERYMRFGWIDFIDDPSVPAALLGAVEDWARETGMDAVHGPLGFTDLDREGMLVEGFNELGTMATLYNYAYYPVHLETLGYGKDIDWVEYEITVPPKPDETIARIADVSQRRCKLKLLQLGNKKQLLKYAPEVFRLLNEAYQHLYGYVPLTDRQMDAYVDQYFGFISPDFVPIVVDQDGRMIAFGIVMPSLSKALQKAGGKLFPFGVLPVLQALKKNDRADLYLVAVRPEYQGKGVNAILMNQMNAVFARLGISRVESNPELETNANVQSQWKYYEKRQHKRRRIYIKHL